MYIIPLAWLYVAILMSVAEATAPNGTVLGAIITFLLYGALPIALLLYYIGAPARRRAMRERDAREQGAQKSLEPDESGLPTSDAVPPVGEKS